MTDAGKFLGMEELGDPLHWRMPVVPEVTTPGNFLFGGCGLGAALVAIEVVPDTGDPPRRLAGAVTGKALVDGRMTVEEGVAACVPSG